MTKVKDFNIDEYKEALEEFAICRRGNRSHRVFELLEQVTPNSYITPELEYLLDRWKNTNPSASWGSCKKPIKRILDILFGTFEK